VDELLVSISFCRWDWMGIILESIFEVKHEHLGVYIA